VTDRAELERRVAATTRAVRRSVDAAVSAELKAVVRAMQSRTHDVTGELDESMKTTREKKNGALIGVVTVEAFYARFVEYGRKNAAPFPFLAPAALEARKRWPQSLSRAVQKGLDDA
jgi:HK97 gp10 family phage protein